jgi:hypothetical protein
MADLLFKIKLVSLIISGIFGGLFVYFFVNFRKLVGFKFEKLSALVKPVESHTGGALSSRWNEIIRHLESNREAEWKLAIIEADNLVDELLKSAGYQGASMGERLMSIEKGQLSSLEGLWEAHKARNKLVHDAGYFLRFAEAKRAIKLFEKAMEELGGL